ncbi:MAG: divalent-cation tolerance protein CutA [Angustibacter sp.]
MSNVVEVVVTGPPDVMPALVEALLRERLIACAQLTPIDSTYRWQGSIEHAAEVRATMHTTNARTEDVMQRVRKLHSYEVPCILVMPVHSGDSDYLAWVGLETGASQ